MTTLPPVSYTPGSGASAFPHNPHSSNGQKQPSGSGSGWWRRPSQPQSQGVASPRSTPTPGSTAASSASSIPSPTSPDVSVLGYYTTSTAYSGHSPREREEGRGGTATFGPASGGVLASLREKQPEEEESNANAGGGGIGGFSIASLRSVFKGKKRPGLDMRPHTSYNRPSPSASTSTSHTTSLTSQVSFTSQASQSSYHPSPASRPHAPLTRTTSYVVPDFEARSRSRAYTGSALPLPGSGQAERAPPRSRSFTVAVDHRPAPPIPRSHTFPSGSAAAGAKAPASAGAAASAGAGGQGSGNDRDRDRERERGREREKPPRPARASAMHEDMRFLRELTELVGREAIFGENDEVGGLAQHAELPEQEQEEGTRRQRDSAKTRPSISTTSAYSDAAEYMTDERPSTDTTGTGPSSRASQPPPVPQSQAQEEEEVPALPLALVLGQLAGGGDLDALERAPTGAAREREAEQRALELSRLQAKAKRHGWALALPAQAEVAPPAPAPPAAPKARPARALSPAPAANRVTAYMTQGFVLSSSPDESRLSSRGLPMPDNSPIVRPVSDAYPPGSSPSSIYSHSHSLAFYRAHDAPSALSLATIGTAGTAGTSDGTSGRGSSSGGLKAIFGGYNPPEGGRRGSNSRSRAQSPTGSHRSRRSEKSAVSGTGPGTGKEEKEERRLLRKTRSSKSVNNVKLPPALELETLRHSVSFEPASPERSVHAQRSKSPEPTTADPQTDGDGDADADSFFGIPLHSPRSSIARPKTAPNPTRSPEKEKEDGRRPSAPAIVQPETPVKKMQQHILPPDELARLMQPSPAPPDGDLTARKPSTTNSVSAPGRRGSEAASLRSTISADKSYFFPSPLPSPSDREFPPWSSTATRVPFDTQASALPSLPAPRRRARNPPSGVTLSPLNTTSRPSSSSGASRLSATPSSVVSPSSSPPSLSGSRPNTSPRIANSRHFFPQRRPPDYAVPPLPDPGIKAAIVAAQAKEDEKKKDDDEIKSGKSEKKKKVVRSGEKITRKPSFLNFDVEDDEDHEFMGNVSEKRKDRKDKKQDKGSSSPPKPKPLADVGRQQSFLDLDDIRQSFESNRSDSDVS
ncbi:hypothetical protein CALVIDRAFT_540617 [Calocera viscosa TUFC12733]|uniref:Uncharacterized protein n=1 Tax=Calocera viscosa (strain TUFC12733) TaxID=1330018 RepID=A0A167IKF7_CALVF|nr:hypothetical protein CALVIDRAFT_540617 [Calocera viscosa TUFC12733]